MKLSALSTALVVLLLSTMLSARPLPQQPAAVAPIDIATPVQQDVTQVNRILSEGTIFLSFPDNGPDE